MGKWHLLYRQPSLGSAPAARCHLKVCQHGMQWVQPKKKKKKRRRISGQILKSLRFPWGFSWLRSISDHIFKKWSFTFYFNQCCPLWNHSVHKYVWASTNVPDIMRSIVMYKSQCWTPLMAHWLRVRLPMEGTRVQSLVWEHPTCCKATKPVHHNY